MNPPGNKVLGPRLLARQTYVHKHNFVPNLRYLLLQTIGKSDHASMAAAHVMDSEEGLNSEGFGAKMFEI